MELFVKNNDVNSKNTKKSINNKNTFKKYSHNYIAHAARRMLFE